MEEVRELINPIITYIFIGLATIISSGISISVSWIIKTLKKHGQIIDVLTVIMTPIDKGVYFCIH